VVGFLGGYTTFSSYSFESLTLWERGEHGLCLAYMFGSVAAGFAGVVLGTALGRGLTGGSA
jgi:CrcB protein